MQHGEWTATLGQLVLAALILGQTILSSLESARRRREDREDREEIARNLIAAQAVLAQQVAAANRERAEDIKATLKEVHGDITDRIVENTAVNEQALIAANSFNEKLPAIADLASKIVQSQAVDKDHRK